jgi:hypothetical protein
MSERNQDAGEASKGTQIVSRHCYGFVAALLFDTKKREAAAGNRTNRVHLPPLKPNIEHSSTRMICSGSDDVTAKLFARSE